MFNKTRLSLLLLPLLSAPVLAEPATELQHMVVTATRTPTPVDAIGSSVTVIDRSDIERRQFLTLADALRDVPGLQVVSLGGRGSQTSVFSRGTNSNHTLVMIDGIEINDPSSPTGAFDFAHFLLDDIESIEIVRGAQSVLYGADAIGAVVHIHTRQGQGDMKARAKLEAGSHATHHEVLALSGSQGKFAYALTGGLFESDGESMVSKKRLPAGSERDDDGYRNKVLSARLDWDITPQLDARFTARHIDSKNEIDGFLAEDPDAYNGSRQTYLGAELKGHFVSGAWQPTLLLTHTDVNRRNSDERQDPLGNTDNSRYLGEKNKVSLQNDIQLSSRQLLTAGYEYEKERLNASGDTRFGGEWGDFILYQSSNASRRNRAFYLQDQIQLTDRLNATLGIRHDNTDDFASETTYRITANYAVSDTSRLRFAHGTGFRAPSLYELYGFTPNNYGNAYYGNPDLDAETSRSFEAGIDQSWLQQRLQTSLTLFRQDIDDLISIVYLPSFDSTSINHREARILGGELQLGYALTDTLALDVNYTYTHSLDEDERQLLRRSRHLANLVVSYQPVTAATLTAVLVYTGARKDVDAMGERVRMGSHAIINVTAAYQLNPQLRLFSRIENLTDRDYEPVYGYQGSGLTGMLGIELTTD